MNKRVLSSFPILAAVVSVLLTTSAGIAQQAESAGEYGAVTVKFGAIGNSGAVFTGGRGGWILDHHFGIGIGGYWLSSNLKARTADTAGDSRLMASYGGLDIEYFVPVDSSFRVSAQAIVGAGAVGHIENRYTNPRPHYGPFVFVEPGVNIDIGLTRVFRLILGGSYRFVGRLSSPVATNGDLTGPLFNVSIKAGFF